MHSDLCLSFPVGDILSESTGNLPILQRGTAEEKVQQLYTWRDSQHCWEEKQRRLNAASEDKNMLTNYLLALTHYDPRPTATQTKQQIQKRIYVITI